MFYRRPPKAAASTHKGKGIQWPCLWCAKNQRRKDGNVILWAKAIWVTKAWGFEGRLIGGAGVGWWWKLWHLARSSFRLDTHGRLRMESCDRLANLCFKFPSRGFQPPRHLHPASQTSHKPKELKWQWRGKKEPWLPLPVKGVHRLTSAACSYHSYYAIAIVALKTQDPNCMLTKAKVETTKASCLLSLSSFFVCLCSTISSKSVNWLCLLVPDCGEMSECFVHVYAQSQKRKVAVRST